MSNKETQTIIESMPLTRDAFLNPKNALAVASWFYETTSLMMSDGKTSAEDAMWMVLSAVREWSQAQRVN